MVKLSIDNYFLWKKLSHVAEWTNQEKLDDIALYGKSLFWTF